jgi:signal transduction histidine kinase
VARAVEQARRHWPAARYTLEAEPAVVRGVPDRLERAIANLLDNAGKWSPPGGEVEVRVRADGTVEVRDNGPGVADEDLPRIFDRFYRAPGARALSGSGLGLAIVRHVVAAHHGTVDASNARGGGAMFRISLPVVAGADEPRPV